MKTTLKTTFFTLLLLSTTTASFAASFSRSSKVIGPAPILKNEWNTVIAPDWKNLLKVVKMNEKNAEICAGMYIMLQEKDEQLSTLRTNGELDEKSYLTRIREYNESMKRTDDMCKNMVGRQKQSEIREQAMDT